MFLGGTAFEWMDLIGRGLLPWTSIFGSTFYTLVGFHALHVTIGLLLLAIVFFTSLSAHRFERSKGVQELISWYWHLVDSVWVVIFPVVYIFMR